MAKAVLKRNAPNSDTSSSPSKRDSKGVGTYVLYNYSNVPIATWGFSKELIEKAGGIHTKDLSAYGIRCHPNISGWAIPSDVADSNVYLALFDTPYQGNKAMQSKGKGQLWYKLMVANQNDKHVYIVEGFKDGLALFYLGFNVLVTGGIHMAFSGFNKLTDEFLNLLEEFDTEDITIVFDIDEKLSTKFLVDHSETRLIKLLEKEEWTEIKTLPNWQVHSNLHKAKDLHDIWKVDEGKTLLKLLDGAVNFTERPMRGVTNSCRPTHTTSSKFVDLDLITQLTREYKITVVKSPMGSGKTYGLIKLLKYAQKLGLSFTVITPLITLGRQITKDLKEGGVQVKYRDQLKTGDFDSSLVCCLESVRPEGKGGFSNSKRKPDIVIIDELPQILKTLRCGSTITTKREIIASTLREIITNSLYTLCLGADVTQVDVELLSELVGIDINKIGFYHNKFKRNNFTLHQVSDLGAVAPKINEIIKNGEQVFMTVDAQKTSSKNAGINLSEHFQCPEDKRLIIDSETVKIKGSDPQRIVEKGELQLLNKYLLIICSPSINSGFSVPPEVYSPKLVVCLHTGCASVDSLIQSTMRIRDISVPRIIVFSGFIKQFYLPANGALTPGDVKRFFATQEKVNQKYTNCKHLKTHAKESGLLDIKNLSLAFPYEDSNLSPHIHINIAIENIKTILREKYVLDMLKEQGAIIATKEETSEFLEVEEIPALEPLKDVRDRNVIKEANEIVAAPDITKKEAEALREMESITKLQQNSLKKQAQQDYIFRYKDVDAEDIADASLGLTNGGKRYYKLTKGTGLILEIESMRQRKLAGKSNFNPGLMLQETNDKDELITITQKDFVEGSQVGSLVVLNKIGLLKAVDYCLKGGLSNFYRKHLGLEAEIPKPIELMLAKARALRQQLQLFFKLQTPLFEEKFNSEKKLLKELFKLVGFTFASKKNIRYKDASNPKIKHQAKIYEKIAPTRAKVKFDKLINAQFDHDSKITTMYRIAKEIARVGKQIISTATDDLLTAIDDIDVLIKASKYLPSDYGLSKFFEFTRHKLGSKLPNPSQITLVKPENLDSVNATLQHWQTNKTHIGLDTETYESLIHKEFCYQTKNGKWKYDNPYTGKTQDVKPGLDQNNNLVRIISLSDGVNTFVFDLTVTDMPAIPLWLKSAWVTLEKLMRTNRIIGHNLKFDTSSLRKYDLVIKHPYDTLITTKLLFLDCGAGRVLPGGYGLKNVSKTFLGKEVDKTLQTSNWGSEDLTSAQLIYAGGDAEDPVHIHNILEEILVDPAKWNLPEFANEQGQHANRQLVGLENRTIYHTTEMQFRGVPFDIPQGKANLKAYEAERQRLLGIWETFEMECAPEQAKKVAEELNRRYKEFEKHPLISEDVDVEIPKLEEKLSGTAKDVIDNHPDLPELLFLKAYREKITVINQISKALLSAEIHNGVCKTEYGILSGTGRFSCGGKDSLGVPNLQALIKSVKSNHFGYIKTKADVIEFWKSGAGVGELTEANTRSPFRLSDAQRAYITEDANASHARLAVGFGQDQFGKKAMEDENVDNHSAFAIQALKVMLKHNPSCLDNFPQIRDFVTTVSSKEISNQKVTKAFKNIDKKYCGKRFRDAAKTLLYSVLNGAQADKMRKVMSGAVGLPLDPGVGQEMFNAYWEMYQGIWAFIQKQLDLAETHTICFGSREYNITTLVDGTKLAFAKENGGVALTKLIACQWSRTEATAIKRILASIEALPKEWGVTLINTVHDEISITCNQEHWVEANKALSDEFAKQYQVYLKGFVPSDEPWEAKLAGKLKGDPNYYPTGWTDK